MHLELIAKFREFLMQENFVNKRENMESYKLRTSISKRILDFFQRTLLQENSYTLESQYISFGIQREIEVGLLSDTVLLKNNIMEVFLNSFEQKYTTPFLLYSLGYQYAEIASILGLPVATVRSRIFYLQKSMQALLIKREDSEK